MRIPRPPTPEKGGVDELGSSSTLEPATQGRTREGRERRLFLEDVELLLLLLPPFPFSDPEGGPGLIKGGVVAARVADSVL